VERVMGIEYMADATFVSRIPWVTNEGKRCVRFLCEKHRHTSQLQRTAANVSFAQLGRGQLTIRPVCGTLDWLNGSFMPCSMP